MDQLESRTGTGALAPDARALRDDRVLRATRVVAAIIIPFLVVAFAILYLRPDDTARLFAWTIKPRMTALIMGAGYIAGAYFFARVLVAARWHEVALGFLPITAFTIFMAIATFLHWDRFNHAHVSFFTWVALYIITPVLVPVIWLRNNRTDPGTFERQDVRLPLPARRILAVAGIVQLALAVILLLFPRLMISSWAWTLTPLTARVIAGWFALPGIVALLMAREPRWSAVRIPLESQLIGLALILVGALRAWSDFNASGAAWAFVGGMGLVIAALLGLYGMMERRRRMPRAGLGAVG